MNSKKNKGFTLIELVVVIAILGILAAVALPRFMNATKDAHRSAVAGVAGALGAGVALVRGQFEVNQGKGVATPQTNVAGFGNGTVDVNAAGWPIGINGAVSCTEVWQNVLQASAPTVGATNTDYVPTYASPVCTYTYQKDGGDDLIQYNHNTGEVTFTFVD